MNTFTLFVLVVVVLLAVLVIIENQLWVATDTVKAGERNLPLGKK